MNLMSNQNFNALQPGQINLSLIPVDWPLTPLGENKNPYKAGWQNKPFTVKDISHEIEEGVCKAVGLLGGPVYNEPYGFVWVDIDGITVYKKIEELAGETVAKALPPTLTICSGREGRERKLYRVPKQLWDKFIRNKYCWHAEGNREKLEVLWKRHQGVLMGMHPKTDGYYTKENEDFTFVNNIPDIPAWLLTEIAIKNKKQGAPQEETTRVFGPNFAINSFISIERTMQEAVEAMWAMPSEAADDYDIWITVGQSLHSVDDTLLDPWDEWSKQSSKYKDGECHRRWLSFSKAGGRGIGSLFHLAKENGWQPDQAYKGLNVDDTLLEYAVQQLEQFEQGVMPPSIEIKSPLRQHRINTVKEVTEDKKAKRNKPDDFIVSMLLTMYEGNFLFSQGHDEFFMYGAKSPGLWAPLNELEAKADIYNKLEVIKDEHLPRGFGPRLINDMYTMLKIQLAFDSWNENKNLLLFKNGVLDVNTLSLMPFQRDFYLIQLLPYDYNPNAECETIIKWLKFTQDGNWGRVQVLRAWLRAVLMGASDIQKFVEIVGPGKSGKSTYANLCNALVGDENTTISTLEHLEKNRFETANLYKKKLLLFNDVERYGGSVSILKALTGRDLLRNEHKYQAGKQKPFKFDGLCMITANEPIQTTDPTSGLARRRLTIPFNNPFRGSAKEQKTLIDMDDQGNAFGEFAPLLPGLVNWLLDMSHDQMREYLMETTKHVKFFAEYTIDQQLKSNPVKDWMHHCLIFELNTSAQIGFKKFAPQGSSTHYAKTNEWLYASYCEFCMNSNNNIMSRSRFESLLMDVFNHQLHLNIYAKRNTKGLRIFNVAIRTGSQRFESYPSLVDLGENPERYKEFYGQIDIGYKQYSSNTPE
jgi:P4 family phage/plasmid primase-like protien